MPLSPARVKNLDDVGMTQVNERADLAGEAIEKVGADRRFIGCERELDDHIGFEVAITGQIHTPHASLADPS